MLSEMKPSSSNDKKFLYFLMRKLLLCFQKWNPELLIPSPKKKTHPEKVSYISRNENPEKLLGN